MKENAILDLSFDFALKIMNYFEVLDANRRFALSNQLLRSGTSIGANIREAQNAESRTDFIHKMKIASKEAEETQYWLLLCKKATNYPSSDHLLDQLLSIKKLPSSIISTSKRSLYNPH